MNVLLYFTVVGTLGFILNRKIIILTTNYASCLIASLSDLSSYAHEAVSATGSLILSHPLNVLLVNLSELVQTCNGLKLALILFVLAVLIPCKSAIGKILVVVLHLSVVLIMSVSLSELEDLYLDTTGCIELPQSLSEVEYAALVPISSGDEACIPWHTTQSISNGIAALHRIYDSLENGSPLKKFINDHCSHLMSPLQGNTGIPVSYGNTKVLLDLPHAVKLNFTHKASQFTSLPGQTGVYVFFTDNELVQCGSSIRFTNRMQSHYKDSSGGVFVFGEHSIDQYNWVPVAYTPNYATEYALNNPITSNEEQLLTFFTQQEVRSIEQAFSTFANPTNYKHIPVNMWHSNWQPGTDYSHMDTGKKVTWVTLDGQPYSRDSIYAASEELGYSHDRVKAVSKVNGALLDTVKYGQVSVSVEGVVKGDTYPDLRSGTPLNTCIDTSDLISNMYYLFDSEMNRLATGPFKTAADVKEKLGLPAKYTGIATWCNYMHLIKSTALGISVYVYKVYRSSDIAMLATNMSTGEVIPYDTVKGMCKKLGLTMSKLLSSLATDGTFKDKHNTVYRFDCVNSADKAKLVARYHAKLESGRQSRKAAKSNVIPTPCST